MTIKTLNVILIILGVTCAPLLAITPPGKPSFKFDFGTGKVQQGYIQVLPSTKYSPKTGFGFIDISHLSAENRQGKNSLLTDFITSSKPFYFSVEVPEGNYNVMVYLGDEKGTSSVTVRAEGRRLMVETFNTPQGKVEARQFTVHIRNALIAGKDSVRLKPRELPYLHWDNQLTLEFNGTNPKVCGVEIYKIREAVTIFLAGNSTVVDQADEPYAAWGQMIPIFFQPGKIAIANYAESGESLKSFQGEKRLEKVMSLIKPGDYFFIEFAHNDQKQGGNYLEAFTTYKETLKFYIDKVREKKAYPVLVTSMHRRNFDDQGKIINTLADYPEAVRQTGKEENVPVIDLNAMSKILYEAWGPEISLKAFVHYPAGTFPGQEKELKDNTHFSPYGAYQLAKCVAEGIRTSDLEVKKYLTNTIKPFNPASPDPIETWTWPLSEKVAVVKPDGN